MLAAPAPPTQAAEAPAAAPVEPRLGLQQAGPARVGNVRKAPVKAPTRKGDVWDGVTIARDHATSPQVKCNYCGHVFCGGVSRIRTHFIEACTCESAAFCELKERLIGGSDKVEAAKAEEVAHNEVLAQVEVAESAQKKTKLLAVGQKVSYSQVPIQSSLASGISEEVDQAIAEMWYGLNIPAYKVDHPLVKKCFKKLRTAPASYVTPNQKRLYGDLLEKTTASLQAEETPMRAEKLKYGSTIISDGWDDITNTHLICHWA